MDCIIIRECGNGDKRKILKLKGLYNNKEYMSIADIEVSKRHAVLDVEIEGLEVEISAAKQRNADILEVMDAEICELEKEIAAAKSKRINDLAVKDAEIAALEKEIAAIKSKQT